MMAIAAIAAIGSIGVAVAQDDTAAPATDAAAPQAERICEQEIVDSQALVAGSSASLEPADQARVESLLAEAQAFCDENNEVMAAIRLEALQAIIEITAP
jgi:hypothetical protein